MAALVGEFTPNSAEPGTADDARGAAASPAVFVQRAARLLADFSASLDQRQESRRPKVVLSASASRPAHGQPTGHHPLARLVRQAEVVALVAALEAVRMAGTMSDRWGARSDVLDQLSRLSRQWDLAARRSTELRRTADLANLVIACLQGTVRDNLLGHPAGFGAVDDLDFRDWLRRHGAAETTLRSPLIRGMYDLVFAYEGRSLLARRCRARRTFDWAVLHPVGKPDDESSPIDAQYWRASVDPSDQYVQSLPGSSAYRLQADGSGYDNLFLAGDWINCGLNAGCIEAAVMPALRLPTPCWAVR